MFWNMMQLWLAEKAVNALIIGGIIAAVALYSMIKKD